jgi:hypothetical protein
MTRPTPRVRALAAALLVALLAVAAWFRPLDDAAGEHLDRGMTAAFAAFATARALNGVISLVQSAQVSAQFGVGMSVAPGELLDPVNDLIERFSDAMLAATVAFGVQKVLLAVGGHWVVALLLGAASLAWAGLAIAGRPSPRWLLRAVALLLLARFAVPVAAVGTDLLARTFLASQQQASNQAIEALTGEARVVAQGGPGAPAGTAGNGEPGAANPSLREWWARGVELGPRIEALARTAGRLAEHVTQLIVVFLLQTLLFPLALAWGMWRAVQSAFRAAPD